MKDHKKSHRAHRHSEQISVQQKSLDLIRSCVILLSPNKDEPTEELLLYQEKSTEVDERTTEVHSEQGNTGSTELVVMDEMTQCEIYSKNTMQKESLFANVDQFFQSYMQKWRKRFAWAGGNSQSRKPRLSKPHSIIPEKYRTIHWQVVQLDREETQTTASACERTAARAQQRRVRTKSQMDLRRSTK